MKYFFSAGEASGDLHASQVISALRTVDPAAVITFLGGDLMASAAGRAPLIHYRDMAFMGFIDVARHLPQVLDNLRRAKQAILDTRPDVLVLVDYPGFNLKLAEWAHGKGFKVHWYIAPKLWAWKEYRIAAMRRCIDRLYSILPFEPQWFGARGLEATYVGNPSVEEVDKALASVPGPGEFRALSALDSRPVLALVPGSRVGEIKANLPVMAAVASRHPQLQAVVAGAPGIDSALYSSITSLPVLKGNTLALMKHSRAALVTSGTASLEAALTHTPQVVCYRAVGWKWAHDLFSHILKIPYCSLPNLVTGPITPEARAKVNRETRITGVRRWIIPEMLVHNCTPAAVDAQLSPLLDDTPERRAQLAGYLQVRTALHTTRPAAATVAAHIAAAATATIGPRPNSIT